MASYADIDNWFMHHPPVGDQVELYKSVRDAGRDMAAVILECSPSSADQSAALRKVREAVMTTNAAIACSGGWEPGQGSGQ